MTLSHCSVFCSSISFISENTSFQPTEFIYGFHIIMRLNNDTFPKKYEIKPP
jgi:hypothetical protein